MTSKIVTRMTLTAALSASIGNAVAALPSGAWQFVVAISRRRELRHLADLDDRLLADIGLTRSDLRVACSEPLWRDPTKMLARCFAARRLGRRAAGAMLIVKEPTATLLS